MAAKAFPADHFRRVSNDGRPVLWSVEEVGQAIADHFNLGRNPNVDERVADLWDAALYIILARLIWEGWLVDWKSRLDDPNYGEPNPNVPACLFDYCGEAVEILAHAGAIRTRYEDTSIEEVLSRFPSTEVDSILVKSSEFFSFYCSKVKELIPLQGEMARLQQHFESAPYSKLPFHIVQLGTRTCGNYPGTFLDVYVGYDPSEDDHAAAFDNTELREAADAREDPRTVEVKLAEETNNEAGQGAPAPAGQRDVETPTGFLGGAALANALGVHATMRKAFFKQLERQRISLGDDCFHEVKDPRPNSPRFLYCADSPTIRDLAAGYRTPKPA